MRKRRSGEENNEVCVLLEAKPLLHISEETTLQELRRGNSMKLQYCGEVKRVLDTNPVRETNVSMTLCCLKKKGHKGKHEVKFQW